jgi:hypothetical protein
MTEYTGTYRSSEADAIITMVIQNNKLVLRTRKSEEPQPPGDSGSARGWYPLEVVCVDAFKNDWMGLVKFTRDSKRQINGFVINNFAGGVRHLQFSKD